MTADENENDWEIDFDALNWTRTKIQEETVSDS